MEKKSRLLSVVAAVAGNAFWGFSFLFARVALQETTPLPTQEKKSSLLWLRLALLSVGIFLLVYGFMTGGTADVLTKAINICTECVGLG